MKCCNVNTKLKTSTYSKKFRHFCAFIDPSNEIIYKKIYTVGSILVSTVLN